MKQPYSKALLIALLSMFSYNCGTENSTTLNYTQITDANISGSIWGLTGAEKLTLINNGSDSVTIDCALIACNSVNDQFVFNSTQIAGSSYSVAVDLGNSAVGAKKCTFVGQTGTVGESDVNNIYVSCQIPGATNFRVGGTISNLSGSGLVLQNNGIDNNSIISNGFLWFPTVIPDGGAYSVTVATQPSNPKQTCNVAGGAGVIATADYAGATITCVTNKYFMGGTIIGLANTESVTLTNNGADSTVFTNNTGIAQNINFQFPTNLNDLSGYNIAVTGLSSMGKTCVVGAGTGSLIGADYSGATVTCSVTPTYTIGVQVLGLNGTIVLQNNLGDNLTINNATPATPVNTTFATSLTDTSAYSVTVFTTPTGPNQTCSVAAAAGTVSGGNVTGPTISCFTNEYAIGGAVVTHVVGTLVLQNNYGETVNVAGGANSFAFPTTRDDGAYYSVSVLTQPGTEFCAVANGSSNINGMDVALSGTPITVTCNVSTTYTIGGTVSGLNGNLTLQESGGDDTVISANGNFTMTTPQAGGWAYAVTALTQPNAPANQVCTIAQGAGTVAATNIITINITCVTESFTAGGLVAGLDLNETLTLQNNLSENILIDGLLAANESFATNPINNGNTYSITVKAGGEPAVKTCVVTGGAGTITTSNITTVNVTCSLDPIYSIGGGITGLDPASTPLVLAETNGPDSKALSGVVTTFTFPISQQDTWAYNTTVTQQPTNPNQNCVVASGSGSISGANVNTISVNCTTLQYAVNGTVTGLVGAENVTVQYNGNAGSNTIVNSGGSGIDGFVLPNINDGTAYNVVVVGGTEPAGKTCSVGAGTGTISGAAISNVTISCTEIPKYTVGGSIAGYNGLGLTLRNSGGDDLAIVASGVYSFSTAITNGTAFTVTVFQNPSNVNQTCTFDTPANATGSMGTANITNVNITCTTTLYSVTANITGTGGGALTLQNNLTDNQSRVADGTVVFTAQNDGSGYSITVSSLPAGRSCNTSGGTLGGTNVTVNITCSANVPRAVTGTVSGLTGSGLVLQNNGGDNQAVAGATHTFVTPVYDGDGYAITVMTQPTSPNQTCTLSSPAGTIAGADGIVNVTCTTTAYTVTGTVNGLVGGESVALTNNGVDARIVNGPSAANNVTFSPQNDGSGYNVQLVAGTDPSGKTCTVDTVGPPTSSGTVSSANITGVTINCVAAPARTVSAAVTGHGGVGNLELQNNGGDNLLIGTAGSSTTAFTSQLQGQNYSVTILNHPTGQICSMDTPGTDNAAGTLAGANVQVDITCYNTGASTTYSIQVTAVGLTGADTVTLSNNGVENKTISVGTNPIIFSQEWNDLTPYTVNIEVKNPPTMPCTLTNGTGLIATANVTNIVVTCGMDPFDGGGGADDVVGGANLLAVDGTSQGHTLHNTGDVDWVSINVTNTTNVHVFETSNGSGGCETDTFLELFQTNGSTLIASDDDSGSGLCSNIQYTFAATGTYYLKVSLSAAPIGGYTLTAAVYTIFFNETFAAGLGSFTTFDRKMGTSGAISPFEVWNNNSVLIAGRNTTLNNFTIINTWSTVAPSDQYVLAASDFALSGIDTDLTSGVIDCSAYTNRVRLVQTGAMHNFSTTNDQLEIEVRSSAPGSGGAWKSIAIIDYDLVTIDTIDVTEYAAGQSDFQVRYRYLAAGWYWYAMLDDIKLIGY